jgi:RNA polymerase sigma-70 factor (ECF subfamily)
VWLFTVCRNQALDVRRKESRMTTLAEIQPTDTHREHPPERMAEDRDEADRVRRGIQELPEKQRTLILLKFRDGLTYREISEQTKLSISNVGYLIHQAIKTLRVRLKQP